MGRDASGFLVDHFGAEPVVSGDVGFPDDGDVEAVAGGAR